MRDDKRTAANDLLDNNGHLDYNERTPSDANRKKYGLFLLHFRSRPSRTESPLPQRPGETSGTVADAVYYGEAIPLGNAKLEMEAAMLDDAAAEAVSNGRPSADSACQDDGSAGVGGTKPQKVKPRSKDPFSKPFSTASQPKKKEQNVSSGCNDGAEPSGQGMKRRPATPLVIEVTPSMVFDEALLPTTSSTPVGKPSVTVAPATTSKARSVGSLSLPCDSQVSSTTAAVTQSGMTTPDHSALLQASDKGESLVVVLPSSPSSFSKSEHASQRSRGSRLRIADWVHAPLDCGYHADMQRRVDSGQLLNTPYEQLLRRCVSAVHELEMPFDDGASTGSGEKKGALTHARASLSSAASPTATRAVELLAKTKEVYQQWRLHRNAGEDIALASNPSNNDPYLGVLQHRLAIEWRLDMLDEITGHIRNAFTQEQHSFQLLVLANAKLTAAAPPTAATDGNKDRRQNAHRHRSHSSYDGVLGENSLSISASPLQGSLPSYGSPLLRENSRGVLESATSASVPPPPSQPIAVMAARSTVLFWQRRVDLCQLFEDVFTDTVALMADLPIFLPESFAAYYAKKKGRRGKRLDEEEDSGLTTVAGRGARSGESSFNNGSSLYREYINSQARSRYLRESPKSVWRAQCAHAQDLLSALMLCWQRHENIREGIRDFEKVHRRSTITVVTAAADPPAAGGGSANFEKLSNKSSRAASLSASGKAPSPSFLLLPTPLPALASETTENTTLLTVAETLELAGLADVKVIFRYTLHSTENAAAAAAALDLLDRDARKALRHVWNGDDGEAAGCLDDLDCNEEEDWLEPNGDHSREIDEGEEEEVLFSAQNLSPCSTDKSHSSPEFFDGADLSSHSFPVPPNSQSASGNGGARRIKVVVGSPMLVGTPTNVDEALPHRPLNDGMARSRDSPTTSACYRQRDVASAHSSRRSVGERSPGCSAKHEKHVTFVLEPTICHDPFASSSVELDWMGGGGRAALVSASAMTAANDAKGDGSREGAWRQSEFSWKRYHDQKGEMTNLFVRPIRPSSLGDGVAFINDRLRAQRQKVLQLFFNLDEEDGAQRLERGLYALRHVDGALRRQIDDIERRIREIKKGDSGSGFSLFRREKLKPNAEVECKVNGRGENAVQSPKQWAVSAPCPMTTALGSPPAKAPVRGSIDDSGDDEVVEFAKGKKVKQRGGTSLKASSLSTRKKSKHEAQCGGDSGCPVM